jgi:hypothetical protein
MVISSPTLLDEAADVSLSFMDRWWPMPLRASIELEGNSTIDSGSRAGASRSAMGRECH